MMNHRLTFSEPPRGPAREGASPSRTPRRVCVLIPTHWEAVMGGAQYQAKLLIEHLMATGGYEVHYLARQVDDAFRPKGYEIHRIGRSRGMSFFLDSQRLLKTLDQIRPDTIYHQVGSAYTGVAAYYCRNRDCRLVWHIASDVDVEPWTGSLPGRLSVAYLDKQLLEYGLRRADCIVAQTRDQVRLLERNYGVSASRIVRNFHHAPTRGTIKQDPVEVLWVANLKRVKQPEVFIRLARDLSHLNLRFTMIGGLQGSDRWQSAMLTEIEHTPNLDYVGELSQEAVNDRLARGHLLVNTSRYEGFSNTFIQAWMREVPVMSLNVDPDGVFAESGLGHCAQGSYSNLLEHVEVLATIHAQRRRIGAKARDYALARHGYANVRELAELL